ncbi:MAG: type I restriction-modification system subunit M [Candidatus Firestonebacteria bacterium]
MAIKKSQLYSSIWKSCDELRGGMDASQYKDYVLVLLFVKYVSDKYEGQRDALIEVPKGGSFKDMVSLKGKKDIGDGINKIIAKLAEANELDIDLPDFNDEGKIGRGKDMQDRLSNLVAIFENKDLDFSKNRAEGDDILGDAYEYLMRNFATESGKSKGQFYTPAEVSRIMAKVIGIGQAKRQDQTIYDPTCGSGSLLLKAADETPKGVTIYGQEMDNATAALAKMNMILHNNPTALIWQDNTLSNPHFLESNGKLKQFDFVVANPPFSNKNWMNGVDPVKDKYERFTGYGIPPKKNGDYAFLLHMIRSLKSNGKGAVILPHGVLFRGNTEGDIRKEIIKRGYIKGIIGLPANLFYGTGIPACIIVLDKENAGSRKGIFMIDASKGFLKDGNKNRLRAQDIHKIVDVFTKQIETAKYSRMIPYAEIEKNEYNLNIPRYIDSHESEDIQDIESHLKGGIPNSDIDALDAYWSICPSLKGNLFTASERKGYSKIKISQEEIRKTIFSHSEFTAYTQEIQKKYIIWQKKTVSIIENVGVGVKPKQLISKISEDILEAFTNAKLIDKYDMYQHLMNYWAETMQDDLYLIASEGWKVELSAILDKNGKPKKDEWECDLIPKSIMISHYFTKEQKTIQEIETNSEGVTRQIEELAEEYGGEEGLLSEAINNKGKITKGDVQKRIKELSDNADDAEELKMLNKCLELLEEETKLNKDIKEDSRLLDSQVKSKYKTLNQSEIKSIVIKEKWMLTIEKDVKGEMDRVSQHLAQRIKELTERYTAPLPTLVTETETLTKKVDEHLKKMGFSV